LKLFTSLACGRWEGGLNSHTLHDIYQ
jgi:hypothetical protein